MVTQLTWNSCLLAIIIIASVITPSKQYIIKSLENITIENQDPGLEQNGTIRHKNHSIHRLFDPDAQASKSTAPTLNILYHFLSGYGGYVMTGPTKVYVLFYGTWTSNQINIIDSFISNIGSTTWFNIEKTYYYQATTTSSKKYIAGPLTFGGAWTTGYPFGTKLTDTNIKSALSSYISNRVVPNDPNGIYLWLSSPDVSETSSLGSYITKYCGYHSFFNIGNTYYTYGFIGNPAQHLGQGCDASWINPNASPNGDRGVDAMISVIAHEIVEAMSNPFAQSWYDSSGNENADKCAWTFGTTYKLSNGASANILVGGRYYLIQQLWHAQLQKCVQTA